MHMPDKIIGFRDSEMQAIALAHALGIEHQIVESHTFPDGESQIRIECHSARPAVLRSLNQPNAKLIEVIFSASALRDQGATQITFICPYLPYMRQDIAFRPGEAVSQRIVGRLLTAHFDAFVSIDPHLHRTPNLSDVFCSKPSLCLTAAPAISTFIQDQGLDQDAVFVGPDIESSAIVSAVADPLDAHWLTAAKVRLGDHQVKIELPDGTSLNGKHVIIVDDVISSGGTITTLCHELGKAGAAHISVFATHALFNDDAMRAMTAAGVAQLMSCDSVKHPSNAISLTPIIAEGLQTWR